MRHSINRILFVNPPEPGLLKTDNSAHYAYFEPPLGLLYVYAYMKERSDCECRFVDLNVELKFESNEGLEPTMAALVEEFQPDMVAISALYYSGIHVFHTIAELARKYAPDAYVVMGGQYPSHLTQDCLADANVDYAVLSEGELALQNLVDALNHGRDIRGIEGLAWRENGGVERNLRTNFWKGYPEIRRLPWEDTKFHLYFRQGRNVLNRIKPMSERRLASLTATRGCPNRCSFCSSKSFWRQNWRKREVDKVIQEIRYLMDNHGVDTIVFNDENIGVHKKWFVTLLKELAKLDITWISGGGLSIRTINDPEIVDLLLESGIGLFNLAVESGYDEALKRVHKPLTTRETEQAVQLLRSYPDLYIIGFFIVGFPFEDWAGVQRTIEFASSLDLDWRSFYCFQPFPGSELFDYCMENKLIDGFKIDYGEVYYAPELKHIDYTSEDLNHINYLSNLRYNFVENRNLKLAEPDRLAQAERDFRYVLDMAPNHVMSLWGISEVRRLQGKPDDRREFLRAALEAKERDAMNWDAYLSELNLDLSQMLTEAQEEG